MTTSIVERLREIERPLLSEIDELKALAKKMADALESAAFRAAHNEMAHVQLICDEALSAYRELIKE